MRSGPPAEVLWAVKRRPLSDAAVRRIVASALRHGRRPGLAVAVVFVSDRRLARLHAEHLGDPRPTDVMVFDLAGVGRGPQAELYVSVDRARTEARERGLALEQELALYVVHGCLHLCGYDDRRARQRAAMRVA